MNINKKLGNRFEWELCRKLASNGYWVHNIAQTAAGQPADIIAVRDGIADLIDCKVCTSAYFRVDRIEDNQLYAMSLWSECGNGTGWFAVLFDESIYMVSLETLLDSGKKCLDKEWFDEHALTLESWIPS